MRFFDVADKMNGMRLKSRQEPFINYIERHGERGALILPLYRPENPALFFSSSSSSCFCSLTPQLPHFPFCKLSATLLLSRGDLNHGGEAKVPLAEENFQGAYYFKGNYFSDGMNQLFRLRRFKLSI